MTRTRHNSLVVRHGAWTPWAFLLPAMAAYAVFVATPIAESFRMSVYAWPTAYSPPVFAGLANFRRLTGDPIFWAALGHNALLLVMSLVIQLPLALLLAILLSYPIRGRRLFRTVFFAPMVMPTVAIALLWSYIYEPDTGLLDRMIQWVQPSFVGEWLSSSSTALLCVFVTICWRYTGFHMVLYMAGLAGIPKELYEAARIDGASEWQVARHVTLPLLKPMIAVSATLSIIGSLKYFDLVYMMARGAPPRARELMATYVYSLAFEDAQGRYGYASAVAVALFLVTFVVILGIQAARTASATDGHG